MPSREQKINCPECGVVLTCYDLEGSAWFGCLSCNTFFSHEGKEQSIKIKEFEEAYIQIPALKIGDTGELFGRHFIVTGFVYKYDPKESLFWMEYMLFSHGEDYYHVLAHSEGNWYYIWKSENQDVELKDTTPGHWQYVAIEKDPHRVYEHYTQYTFSILYAGGEFDTNILDDARKMLVDEFTDDNGILVCETNDGAGTWFRGLRLPSKKIRAAFGKTQTGEIEESFQEAFERKWSGARNMGLVMVTVILLTHLALGMFKSPKQLLAQQYAMARDTAKLESILPIEAGTIKVNGPTAVDFDLSAEVYNDWIEISVTVMNIKDGKTYEFTKAIEHYSGYEGGEWWTEGSREATAVLSLPSGTYRVNIYPFASTLKNVPIGLIVYQNATLYSNFYLMLLLVCAYPAWLYMNKRMREEWKNK
jgi:hypothetical protein